MNANSNPYKTEKELLYLIKFDKQEVLKNKMERKMRRLDLFRGMQLGNLYKSKVMITFKDSLDNLLMIHTTIWGLTQRAIILKKGITIPIHSILRVE